MKKKSKLFKILSVILSLLVVLMLGFAFWLPSVILTGDRQTLEEAFTWQSQRMILHMKRSKKTDYLVKGFEDYDLHVQPLENPIKTDNCIIYGIERVRYPKLTTLGLHSKSLSTATSITSLKYKPKVDFVVADCGFSDIENVLKTSYANAHLPTALVDIANFTGKIRYHYSLKAMRPIDALEDNIIPILFIHGADDTFILPKNSEDMAKRTKGYHELHLIPKARHAMSILTAPQAYQKIVKTYLQKVNTLEATDNKQ